MIPAAQVRDWGRRVAAIALAAIVVGTMLHIAAALPEPAAQIGAVLRNAGVVGAVVAGVLVAYARRGGPR